MIGENLLRYQIYNKKSIVIDCESESLNLYFSRPWSIGWLVCEGKKIVEEHHHYLKWNDINVSKGAAAQTGFDLLKYNEIAEDPKLIYNKFSKYLYDKECVKLAHNGTNFDIFQIASWQRGVGEKVNYDYIDDKFMDSNAIAKGIKLGIQPTQPLSEWMFRVNNYYQKGLRTNLSLLAKEYGIKIDESERHGALYDCQVTWEIFLRQINEIEI